MNQSIPPFNSRLKCETFELSLTPFTIMS